eukprot:9696630-Alexandrium_andersonii.AAC.1
MSASLVGSEMCIRDRSSTQWRRPRSQFQRPWVRPSPEPQGRPWQSHCPVSYTHLTLPTICSV